MTPTQDFENYPEFANAGQKSQPNDAKYAAGFIPSDVLPAEWLNWFLNGATKGVTALNTGVKSIEQEINSVLESRSVTPDINAAGQLLSVLNKIKAEAVLAAHPVGSLYWTSKNENPAVTFGGGTWKQITDKFVLAAGSTYKAEATGGKETVTLTKENMPSHSHTFTPSGTITMDAHSHGLNGHSHTFKPSGTVSSHSHSFTPDGTISETTDLTGTLGPWVTDSGSNERVGLIPSGWAGIFSKKESSINSRLNEKYGTGSGAMSVNINVNHSHSFIGTTKNTEISTPAFIGTQGTTSSAASTVQSTTSSGSFSGSAGTTDSSGSGAAFSIMPPYVVKYCWERTA
ncbi:hypothetical protein [uncultured Treponema sp.]|uniref:phage baseplate protein n=1 Tax=uncultured Treponema sp. TaxID=162155 RepID=UPI0025CFA2B9|nr:hypothetical protein [uncultured Treponema sp.]